MPAPGHDQDWLAERLNHPEPETERERVWREQVSGLGVVHRDLQSPSLTMLVLLATLGVLLYASFLARPGNVGDLLPWSIVILCEGIMMFQVLVSLWTQLSSAHDPRDFAYHAARRDLFMPTVFDLDMPLVPSEQLQLDGRPVNVDIFVTTYGEPVATIRRTVAAARQVRGETKVWVLDDGRSPEVEKMAREEGAHYLTRPDNTGAKAGNINHALTRTEGEFFVILDADFVPSPDLLVETVPFFARDAVAFVQTPQVYGNIKNFISRGSGFMQTVFYSLIQPGKNRFNSAFCVGTNVVFRRSAVLDVGGIYAESKSEDIWTSIRLHQKGYESVYIPTILAIGDTPETIEAYTKQQVRWATGAFEVLFRNNPLLDKRLSVDQRLQYFGTSTFYLSGLVTFLLLILPALQIFLGLTPINPSIPLWQWALFYSGFYVMQIVVAIYTIGSFRWETLLLSTVSFPLYLRALWNGLLGRDLAWHVTGSEGRANSPFNYVVPQALMWFFLILTSIVGIWVADWTGVLSIALAWNLFNMVVLTVFMGIAVGEARRLRRKPRDGSEPSAASSAPTATRPVTPIDPIPDSPRLGERSAHRRASAGRRTLNLQ
ncbi:MAG: glycosyltransferase [Ornithinimicrobium sp.]|uniref:glycosyltransferase family 2 protein n=1 Tax=Ornithinimicrobium sp. TaxID=1977084 RepID=UPI0026E080DE|nr:glycosyltransferase family 2 protein [Ornithinimicrobium sp.]MDO5739776.1 glycosyltransferase [Ornithinimicrobium sp.]